MKIIKKLIEKDKEMTAKTPKKVRILNLISLLSFIVLYGFLGFHLITTVFALIAVFTHPYIFSMLKDVYNTSKILNSEELDWLELK